MPGVRDIREAILHYTHLIYAKGWVANHEGNLTTRVSADRFLCTPTAFSKADIAERDLIEVDQERTVLRGFRRPFSEFSLHRAVYEARPDVRAVIHAHPPSATAFSVCGRGLDRAIVAESVVSLGPSIPCVPFSMPGSPEERELVGRFALRYDVLILGNHGVLAFGEDLEQAYLRLEYCEHLAHIERLSMQVGSPRYLSWREVDTLLDRRRAAGLGPEARGMSREEAYSLARKSYDT